MRPNPNFELVVVNRHDRAALLKLLSELDGAANVEAWLAARTERGGASLSKALHAEYAKWCEQAGQTAVGIKTFAQGLVANVALGARPQLGPVMLERGDGVVVKHRPTVRPPVLVHREVEQDAEGDERGVRTGRRGLLPHPLNLPPILRRRAGLQLAGATDVGVQHLLQRHAQRLLLLGHLAWVDAALELVAVLVCLAARLVHRPRSVAADRDAHVRRRAVHPPCAMNFDSPLGVTRRPNPFVSVSQYSASVLLGCGLATRSMFVLVSLSSGMSAPRKSVLSSWGLLTLTHALRPRGKNVGLLRVVLTYEYSC